MAETKNREKTPLNECMVKIINGTRYKVYSIYTGDRDFRHLYENLVVTIHGLGAAHSNNSGRY